MPYLGADWGPLVARAGFTDVAERAFGIDLGPPLPGSAGRYAQGYLRRVRGHLDGALAADDLATLDVLIGDDGPGSVLRRRDLAIRNTRTIWTATRP
jgi:hypothetical protein